MINKELFKYRDNLYWIFRKVKEHQLKPEVVAPLREYWGCDLVLRNNQGEEKYLYFLVEIPEAEVIEFIPNSK